MARTQAVIFKKMATELNVNLFQIELMPYIELIGYLDVTMEGEEIQRKTFEDGNK